MQISDLMGQYHQAPTGTERYTGTKGIENLVASVRSLTKGNIFEGTVNSMKNGQVTLALANGQLLSARMEGKVPLSVGQSMFFQVKSNDGTQIAIRPFLVDGSGGNYTLLQALSAAGLPQEPKYLSMVNRMMEEQMPIDRASLQQMARMANANPEINVQTLVQLHKLGLPITVENASQLENYMNDRQAITAELDHFIEELPAAMQGNELPAEQMRQVGGQILSIITENLADAPEGIQKEQQTPVIADESGAVNQTGEPMQQGEVTQTAAAQDTAELTAADQMANEVAEPTAADQTVNGEAAVSESTQTAGGQEQYAEWDTSSAPHTLGSLLEPEQVEHLNQILGKLLGTETLKYGKDSEAAEALRDLGQVMKTALPMEREHLQKLFSSKEFKSLVKDTIEQQWMIKPSELAQEDKIGKLYERLTGQMERIENVMKAAGQENTNFTQLATDIRSNVEFMNQINQVYTYAQIPLKMSGRNASGELYVYTNKKALAQGDKDLTAFLHLDLDHLGATDVSVRMRGREVNTRFYMEDDSAYDMIAYNLPLLEARLKKRGYNCTFSAVKENHHVNFVEDFLKKDQPSAGQLHRYSFDVRA